MAILGMALFPQCSRTPPTAVATAIAGSRAFVAREARPVNRSRSPRTDVFREIYMGQPEPDPLVVHRHADPALCKATRVSYDFSRAMVDGGKTGVDVEVRRPDGTTLNFGFALKAMIPDATWCAVGSTFHLVNNAPGLGVQSGRKDNLEYRRYDLRDGRLLRHQVLVSGRPMVSGLALAYMPEAKSLLLVWDESEGFQSGLHRLSIPTDGSPLPQVHGIPKPSDLCFYDPRFLETGKGVALVTRARRLISWNRYRDIQTVALMAVDPMGTLGKPRFLPWQDTYIESLSIHPDGTVVFKPVKMDPLEIPFESLPEFEMP